MGLSRESHLLMFPETKMNSNSQNNAYTCLGYVNQALLSLQNNGEMTPPASPYLPQYLNSSPANREQ